MGSFVAALILYGQYNEQIKELVSLLTKANKPLIAQAGPAGILSSYPQAKQMNQGWLFMVEFFADGFIVRTLIAFEQATLTGFAGSSYMVSFGSSKPIHHPECRAFYHRPCLCCHDLGLCTSWYQHESRQRLGMQGSHNHLLWRRSLDLPYILVGIAVRQYSRNALRDVLLRDGATRFFGPDRLGPC